MRSLAHDATAGANGVLFDLLMAVMNSLEIWTATAPDHQRGLVWRDAVAARMLKSHSYVPYEDLVAAAAMDVGLPLGAPAELFKRWSEMEPWPDAAAVLGLALPYGFVTNCSTDLAHTAARRSDLLPQFVLSAQEAGWYKPESAMYRAACWKLGTEPARTMFVAGSPYDAGGARAAGLDAWLVLRRPDHRPPDASIPAATSLEKIVAAIAQNTPARE